MKAIPKSRTGLTLVLLASISTTGCITNNSGIGAEDTFARFRSMTNNQLCQGALEYSGGKFLWNTKYRGAYSNEAKNRGLTPTQCAALTGKTAINYIPTKTICYTAITKTGSNFAWTNNGTPGYVAEAKRRGLTPENCASLTGRSTTQVARTRPETIDEPTLASTGTGFFLSAKGQIITNAHVVDGCRFTRILYQNQGYDVSLLEVDQRNDLALLQSTITGNKAALLEIDRLPRLGEPIIVFGYPLSSVLSSKPKITDGIISSTAGLGDDSRYFQISAPIQPGNSGGPLLDKFGRVIGITTAKLDDGWSIKNTGSIAQNVNFAIKAIVVRTFLDSNNVVINKPKQAPRQISLPDIAEAADLYTVQVGCFK
jgi:S1-C subfamily serine protease